MSRKLANTDSIAAFIADWQRERPDLDPWPLGIFGRTSRIVSHFLKRADSWLSPLGLSWETFSLIAALRRSGKPYELNPTELQRQSLLTSGAMTNRINRVEALGLVERRPDSNDGRGVIVRLTPAGRALADKAIAVHFSQSANVLGTLNAREREQLHQLLAKLLNSLENAPPAPAATTVPTTTRIPITTPPPAPIALKLLPGEAVVGEISQPFAAKLVHKDGSSPGGACTIRLAAAVLLSGNKKVPPNTVLAVAKDGTIAPAADAATAGTALAWKFTKTKDVMVSVAGGPVKTLYDYLKETGATSISKHKAWKAGSVPTTLDFAGSAAGSASPGVLFVPSSAVHRVAGGHCIGRPGRAAWLGMGIALRRGVPTAPLRSHEPLS